MTLAAARDGDEQAFGSLIEPFRGELHAHCYRMLGSVHDAEDALQEAMLRAWRGLGRFEGRSSLRSWLYTIATNTCLNLISSARRDKRVLPLDHAPPADAADGPGLPLSETVWVEPYPDSELDYEQREGVELAFIAALQHLPPNQRAVLILREVLGFSARETAATLETSVAAVNSALQRSRKTVAELAPSRSQQENLRAIGDARLEQIVAAYMDAMQRGDVGRVVSMLAEDAAWSMPPAAAWFGPGVGAVSEFLRVGPLSGAWQWKHAAGSASGQPAVGAYTWDASSGCYLPFALDVLTLDGDRIKEVTAYIVRATGGGTDLDYYRDWPAQPLDPAKVERFFERVGLPGRLD